MTLARVVKEWEAHNDVSWPLPLKVTAQALAELRMDEQDLNALLAQYLGRGKNIGEVVRGVMSEDIPVDVWPFTHIDWQAAADETDATAAALHIEPDYWFDTTVPRRRGQSA